MRKLKTDVVFFNFYNAGGLLKKPLVNLKSLSNKRFRALVKFIEGNWIEKIECEECQTLYVPRKDIPRCFESIIMQ